MKLFPSMIVKSMQKSVLAGVDKLHRNVDYFTDDNRVYPSIQRDFCWELVVLHTL